MPDIKVERLNKLRAPFTPAQMGKRPQPLKKDDDDKGRCVQGSKYSADGVYCGAYHARSIHLDFVGHAALTDRFLDIDPTWTWEPLALGPDGLPAIDRNGGMWIRLTICDVTRLGYGDAQGKTGANAVKETIGDALRNAGMRFGAALDLWHKGDLHAGTDDEPTAQPKSPRGEVVAELPDPTRAVDDWSTTDPTVNVGDWVTIIRQCETLKELYTRRDEITELQLSKLHEAELKNAWNDQFDKLKAGDAP